MKVLVSALFLALLALHQQGVKSQDEDIRTKRVYVPLVEMTQKQVRAYERNPKFRPRLLEPIPKKGEHQPASAGISYFESEGRIIGGSSVAQKQFPWQAYIVVDKLVLCGGTLIGPTWVLTSAQCVVGGKSFNVTVGGVDRTSAETKEQTQTSTIAIKHEQFKPPSGNDIALIQLPAPFTLDDYVNVIRLPKPSQAKVTFEGSNVTVSGYGIDDNMGIPNNPSPVLNSVTLLVMKNSDCAKFYGQQTVGSSAMCTNNSTNTSTCTGDTGGPLMLKEGDGKWTQIGIISFGSWHSCLGFPVGYTRLSSFLGWIAKKTNIITTG